MAAGVLRTVPLAGELTSSLISRAADRHGLRRPAACCGCEVPQLPCWKCAVDSPRGAARPAFQVLSDVTHVQPVMSDPLGQVRRFLGGHRRHGPGHRQVEGFANELSGAFVAQANYPSGR